MGTKLVLGLWSLSCIVSIVSSKAVISCTDKGTCKNLRIITTNSNEIPNGVRQYQQSAESIDLHGNLMESFSGNDIASVRQLKFINLSYNLLHGEVLNGIGSQVQEIDLTYNQLTYVTVPASVRRFLAVRNKLVETKFAGSNLVELNLSMNKLDKIPKIGSQLKIETVDLSCNEISEVDFNTFSGLQFLKTLNLANNRIHQTSGDRTIQSLQNLDLSHNLLTIFDESMESASNVRELNVRNNEIVMIMVNKPFSNLETIDFRENDWDCNKLHQFLDKTRAQPLPDSSCKYGSLGKHNLCCSTTPSPYADRVIRYNKRVFEAQQNSSSIQQQGVNCANYVPSPCNGDDNKVYEVANAAANDIQTLVSQDKDAMLGVLNQQRNLLERKQNEKARIDRDNMALQATLDELTGYIGKLYVEEGVQGTATNPAEQLKQIFANRDAENKATLEQVNEEERKLQNLLTDITKIEEDLQDLGQRKNKLLNEINTRNATVIEQEKKIQELKVKLGRA
uniref:Putative lrr toll n=1 Tax=Culex tarsalis TaxID=7177 RepID=A0A1Q3FNN1_CULTA